MDMEALVPISSARRLDDSVCEMVPARPQRQYFGGGVQGEKARQEYREDGKTVHGFTCCFVKFFGTLVYYRLNFGFRAWGGPFSQLAWMAEMEGEMRAYLY